MIFAHLTLLPWGLTCGAPCIALDVTPAGRMPDAETLAGALRVAVRDHHGISTIWIRSAPWASEEWARCMDGGLAEHEAIYATQEFGPEASWGFRDVVWFVDASPLLKVPTTPAAIASAVARIPGFPTPGELVVHDVAAENLAAPLLDAVMNNIGGPRVLGELQVAAPDLEVAMMAAARASGAWRVRVPEVFPARKLFELGGA